MSVSITQRPNVNTNWVPTSNPIIYKFQRKDFTTNSVTNSGGLALVKVTGDITAQITVGDLMYYSQDNGAIPAGTYAVTAKSFAAGETSITLNVTYVAGTTGWINLMTARPGYYVEVELYYNTGGALLFSAFKFYPNSAGAVVAGDVSGVMNDFVTQDTMNGVELTQQWPWSSARSRLNVNGAIPVYIKYREVWTGSANSQTSDSANPFYAVKGVRQILDPWGAYLKEYAEPTANQVRAFLTKFSQPTFWIGRKNTLSYLDVDAPANPRVLVKKLYYNQDGSLWGGTYELPNTTGSTTPGMYDVVEEFLSTVPNYKKGLQYDKETGAGTSWSSLGAAEPQVVLTAGASSKQMYFPQFVKSGQACPVQFTLSLSAGGAATITATVVLMDSAGVVKATYTSPAYAQGTSPVVSTILTPSADAYLLGVVLTHSGGADSRTCTTQNWAVTPPVIEGYKSMEIQLVTIATTITATETVISQGAGKLYLNVKTPSQNAVQLVWKNSLGGEANWVFDWSQAYTYRYQDGKKKRMVLYAMGLTANDWEAINELNTSGEIYKPAVNEFTSAITRTHDRRGAKVYMITSTGIKTGVIVIPTELRTRSEKIQHQIEITIELPDYQEVR